jgi:hypothetical protein
MKRIREEGLFQSMAQAFRSITTALGFGSSDSVLDLEENLDSTSGERLVTQEETDKIVQETRKLNLSKHKSTPKMNIGKSFIRQIVYHH